jgi:hypothetical protein
LIYVRERSYIENSENINIAFGNLATIAECLYNAVTKGLGQYTPLERLNARLRFLNIAEGITFYATTYGQLVLSTSMFLESTASIRKNFMREMGFDRYSYGSP